MVMVVGGFVVVKGELALVVGDARSEIPLCAKRFNSVVGLGEPWCHHSKSSGYR